jgi:L-fuconolactonase
MNRRQALALLAAAAVPPAAAARKYHIIDPHVHVWKNDARFPWSKETANPPVQDATPEMLIDLMRANGVEKTVIVQVRKPLRWCATK